MLHDADLIAALREAEGYEEELAGQLNMIIEACWRTGIQYDRELDDDKNDYPMRVIRDLHAALREAEAKLAAIREFADDLAARGDAIAEANPDHVIHIEQCRQHASMIRAILDGKGELTT